MAYQFSMRSSVRRRSQKCVSTACGSRRHRIARRHSRSTLTKVCVHSGSRRHRIARRRSQKCVSTLGQDGTESHVDAHGQHSQKCVSTVGQDGTELHVDAHGQHSQKCVCPLWVKTACIWLVPHTRQMGASQTVSDHWGFQTERTTSKWSRVCLMYMDLGSTLQCASTPVGPYWFHVPSWET